MLFTLNALVWLGLVVLFILLEAATVSLVSIWFAAGAVAALLSSVITVSVPVQVTIFLVVSLIALIAMRPLVKKSRLLKMQPTNAERNVGRKAVVITAVRPDFPGRVRLDGVDWSACASVPLEVGAVCEVLAVHGAKLEVCPETQPAVAVGAH